MKFKSFTVLPAVPPKLEPLMEMAYNIWYAWSYEAAQLFKKLDVGLWRLSSQNPVRMLCLISQDKLEKAAADDSFIKEMEEVYSNFKDYLNRDSWFQVEHGNRDKPLIAYFSCEFGMHESLPIYSGGLGVLAGDHLKSASDLGLPLVGVGLLYREGYFKQHINMEGMQIESYPENDWYSLPVKLAKDKSGKPLTLKIKMANDIIHYHVWKVNVGRIQLYLLDTNVEENTSEIKDITKRLYDSDREIRIRQEILLGMGGVEALRQVGKYPTVFHCNEGHSAFLMLERIKKIILQDGLNFGQARQATMSANVFTTHTPVPAGNERFDIPLVEKYFKTTAEELGLEWNKFLALGRENPKDDRESFCMTVLALKLSSFHNGVSKLHGKISRNMWKNLYSNINGRDIPIGHVTNGVHIKSWLSPHLSSLIFRYSDPKQIDSSSEFGNELSEISPKDLWKAHQMRRKKLVEFARMRIKEAILKRGGSPKSLGDVYNFLDPEALTIGFARRFATYKRGDLILQNSERFKKILTNPEFPVQFILAGKAHPADIAGKEVIKRIHNFARSENLQDKIIILEDYDINVARHLVQGADLWLNNPHRPLEASGTSGMKAAINGCLNLSIPDGWWAEAFNPDVGWSIGSGEDYQDTNYQNEVEGNLLYRCLEEEVIPLFYQRDARGVPWDWVKMMKNSIHQLGSQFNSHRMVMDYTQKYYLPAENFSQKIQNDGFQGARDLDKWYQKLESDWDTIKILKVESNANEVMYSGEELSVSATVNLGKFLSDNIKVEVYHGSLNNKDNIEMGYREPMSINKENGEKKFYKASIPCKRGGRYGFCVRIIPGHPLLSEEFLPGYMHSSS